MVSTFAAAFPTLALATSCASAVKALVQIVVTSKKRFPFAAAETSSPKYHVPNLRRRLTLDAERSQSELSLLDAVQ